MHDESTQYVVVHKDDLRLALFHLSEAIQRGDKRCKEPINVDTVAAHHRMADAYDRAHRDAPPEKKDMIIGMVLAFLEAEGLELRARSPSR